MAEQARRRTKVRGLDASFAHFDFDEECTAEIRFDVKWRCPTGQWWRLPVSVPLEEALRPIETQQLLRPPT